MGAAFQMIVGGGAVAIVGTLLGEWQSWHLTGRAIGAIAYLVVFGSILGYSAYSYALRRSEEHTSDSSHLGISYAVFCLKKKKKRIKTGPGSKPCSSQAGRTGG